MEHKQLIEISSKTDDPKYIRFILDEGWKYDTEKDILAGFKRKEKATNGTLLTFDEFLAEFQDKDDSVILRQLYNTLCGYVKEEILSPYGVYQYAKFRWCIKSPEAVVAYQVGPKKWRINNCSEIIPEEQAKSVINSKFGFEANRLKLLGIPYYDATDWNFICFRCGGYDWLMQDGSLYQIYQ